MNPTPPLVSIIMPSFNQSAYLETAIQSVLGQDYPNVELILIDGGSTDGTMDVIQKYADQLAYWQSRPDEGQADAINQGFDRAQGEFIAWLNSDDVYLPGAIGEAVSHLQDHPDLAMVFGNGYMVSADLELLDKHRYRPVDLVDLLSFEVILQPAVFMRGSNLRQTGFLNPAYNLILDHELWVRLASAHPTSHVDRYWCLERTHASAKTIALAEAFVAEAERLIDWAWSQPDIRARAEKHNKRITAGLKIFSARRLIDAGKSKTAFRLLLQAMLIHPASVLRYWYKVVQAGFSAIGLGWAFELYRRSRRRWMHRGKKVTWESARFD